MNELKILNNWDKAKQAIALCKDIDEVKQIRDKAEALRVYAKQAKESLEVQNNIAEIRLRCERRMGEFSKELETKPGTRTDLTSLHRVVKFEVLKGAGIDTRIYQRYEAIASLPEKKFNEHIKEVKASKKELTTVGVIRLTKELKKEEVKENSKLRLIKADESKIDIKCGDFRELTKNIPDNSISLVLADPPYGKEYLSLWSDLSRESARILKPSGFLISYSGQSYLSQVMNKLSENLSYYWLGMLYHKGHIGRCINVNFFNRAKPILFYQKPPKKKQDKWLEDVLISDKANKSLHKWGQNMNPLKVLIEHFTDIGSIVCDPMFGGGSTIVACIETKRNFVGFEIDKKYFDSVKENING